MHESLLLSHPVIVIFGVKKLSSAKGYSARWGYTLFAESEHSDGKRLLAPNSNQIAHGVSVK